MSIARLELRAPAHRPVRLVWSGVLAVLALALAVSPALAVVSPLRAEPDAAGRSRSVSAPAPAFVTAPAASQAPSPDAAASPSPSASASPDPSASPEPSPSTSPDPSASASPDPSPTATPTPDPTPAWSKTVTTVGTSIRFYGRGNGHGVGMSQWGAKGRATAGQKAHEILAAYFRGSTVGTLTTSRYVRVLVLSGYAGAAASPLTIHGRSGAWSITGVTGSFPADAALTVWRTSAVVSGATVITWHLHVVAADGKTVLYDGKAPSATVTIKTVDAASRLQLNSKPSTYDTYRGRLVLTLKSTSVSVVNWVQLDDYLKGVVPVEMPASWPLEALSAQAIVARSWTVKHFRSTTTYTYDVYDDTRSQVYRGVKAENASVSALITAQTGGVLYYGTGVVNAFYCAAAGGWTENNEDAFVGSNGVISSSPLPYLRGRDDRSATGAAFDAGAPGFAWSTASITHAQLNAILAADSRTSVGTVTKLNLTHRGASGRLYQVVIYGSTGRKTVSGDVFRAVFNAHRPAGTASMLSNLFDASPLP
jgi:stage II sporulation protein D